MYNVPAPAGLSFGIGFGAYQNRSVIKPIKIRLWNYLLTIYSLFCGVIVIDKVIVILDP
jgi:hypothetical protein